MLFRSHSGFARLAGLLRGVGIGFRRQRYATKLVDAIRSLENKLQAVEQGDEDGGEVSPARQEAVRRDLRDMRVLQNLVARLLNTCPDGSSNAGEIITKAREFIDGVARSVSKLDRFAAERLTHELVDMEYWLSRGDQTGVELRRWLQGPSCRNACDG